MLKVLIVDDDFWILRGLRKVLERDYEVKVASDEAMALQVAEEFRPSVAFVDLVLGYDSGLDVIEKLRAMLPDSALVLMSSHHPGRISDEFDVVGADGFLAKEELGLIGGLLHRIERAL